MTTSDNPHPIGLKTKHALQARRDVEVNVAVRDDLFDLGWYVTVWTQDMSRWGQFFVPYEDEDDPHELIEEFVQEFWPELMQ